MNNKEDNKNEDKQTKEKVKNVIESEISKLHLVTLASADGNQTLRVIIGLNWGRNPHEERVMLKLMRI